MAVSPTVLLSLVIVLALVHGASGGEFMYHCKDGLLLSSYDETKCFKVIRSVRKTWNGAKAACIARGGTLASGVQVREDILGVTRSLRFRAHFWIGVTIAGVDWVDLNGTPVPKTHFKPGRGSRHKCVTVKKGSRFWYDKNCNKRHFFVCQYDSEMLHIGK